MDKLDILKQTLSKVANREIDITIRGKNKFTFSFLLKSKQSFLSDFENLITIIHLSRLNSASFNDIFPEKINFSPELQL